MVIAVELVVPIIKGEELDDDEDWNVWEELPSKSRRANVEEKDGHFEDTSVDNFDVNSLFLSIAPLVAPEVHSALVFFLWLP